MRRVELRATFLLRERCRLFLLMRPVFIAAFVILFALIACGYVVLFVVFSENAKAQACVNGCETPVAGCVVKGNINFETGEKIYHLPSARYYRETVVNPERGERWFCSEAQAQANGWRASLP